MNSQEISIQNLTLSPIGTIHTPMNSKFDAPHQPDKALAQQSIITLLPNQGFDRALGDLDGFSHIWLIWWFHKNSTWRPRVLPPRGPAKRRGVFATRSPHRPNPVGITAVPLIAIKGLNIYVGTNDLIDGTPILDIKPYLVNNDSFSDAKKGWIGEVEEYLDNSTKYEVVFSENALKHINWLKDKKIDFTKRVLDILSVDPFPHRTRRIMSLEEGIYRMGCGAWRLYYTIEGTKVMVSKITIGYPLDSLKSSKSDYLLQKEMLLQFWEKFEK